MSHSQLSKSLVLQQQAAACFANGEYEQAIFLYEQCLNFDSAVLDYYWALGLAWLLQGDEANAQAVWVSALTVTDAATVEAGMVDLLQRLQQEAERQLRLGRADLAERIDLQALELADAEASLYVHLGHSVALQGRYEEAIAHWQSAMALDPNCVEAYRAQGDVWLALNQNSAAIAAYSQAVDLMPDWQTHCKLGLCFGKQQQWTAAIAQFSESIRLNPDQASAYGNRGWAWLQQRNWTAAIADLQQALHHKSEFARLYCHWMETLTQKNRTNSRLNRNAAFLNQIGSPSATLQLDQILELWRSPIRSNLEATGETIANPQSPPLSVHPQQPHRPAIPSAWHESTRVWSEATPNPSNRYIPLDPPSVVPLVLPKSGDRTLHFSFRFGPAVTLPGTFVATIANGQCWLSSDQTASAILTGDRHLLADLSPDFPLLSPGHPDKHPSRHAIFSVRQFPQLEVIKGTIAVLSGLANSMYFHWMFDVLPRFNLLQRSGIDLEQVDYFLVNHHLPFQQETLQLLGIPETKILEAQDYPYLQATRLIVPSFPGSPAWMPKWACDWLRQMFLENVAIASKPGTRLYITRSSSGDRRIINETAVLEYLSSLGFECVALEALSVIEQAALLSTAEVVVAPHGSGLTNLVFCNPGTKIIEIFSPYYVYPCYWLLSNLMGLEYYYLTGAVPEGFFLHQWLYDNPRTEDIFVQLDELKTWLNLAGIS